MFKKLKGKFFTYRSFKSSGLHKAFNTCLYSLFDWYDPSNIIIKLYR